MISSSIPRIPAARRAPVTPPSSNIRSSADTKDPFATVTPPYPHNGTSRAYPRDTPLTPPSPVLSVSQLAIPPMRFNGTIPIFFDSDSSSESLSEDEDLPGPDGEESPSAAARRRSEVAARLLRQTRHASVASNASDAPTVSGQSINSFGAPRLFEKTALDDTVDWRSGRHSATTASSFIHPRPPSALSIASTNTVDSPLSALQNLPPVKNVRKPAFTSMRDRADSSSSLDAIMWDDDDDEDTTITGGLPPYSLSGRCFSALAQLRASRSVEDHRAHHPFSAAAQASDDEPTPSLLPTSSSFSISAYMQEENIIIPTNPSTSFIPEVFPTSLSLSSSSSTVKKPDQHRSNIPVAKSKLPIFTGPQPSPPPFRITHSIPPNMVPMQPVDGSVGGVSGPASSASIFAQRVSEQYQLHLDREREQEAQANADGGGSGRMSPFGIGRPPSRSRPGTGTASASRPGTAQQRPGSSSARPGTGNRRLSVSMQFRSRSPSAAQAISVSGSTALVNGISKATAAAGVIPENANANANRLTGCPRSPDINEHTNATSGQSQPHPPSSISVSVSIPHDHTNTYTAARARAKGRGRPSTSSGAITTTTSAITTSPVLHVAALAKDLPLPPPSISSSGPRTGSRDRPAAPVSLIPVARHRIQPPSKPAALGPATRRPSVTFLDPASPTAQDMGRERSQSGTGAGSKTSGGIDNGGAELQSPRPRSASRSVSGGWPVGVSASLSRDTHPHGQQGPSRPRSSSQQTPHAHGQTYGKGPSAYAELASDDGLSSTRPSQSFSQLDDEEQKLDLDLSAEPRLATTSSDVPGGLADTVLTLAIDQEHFREIMPQFVFSRSPAVPADQLHGASDTSTVLEFKMVQRQSWAFHHASLDTPPTLRRLLINGDMKRDYLSREASLALKSNGVYVVRGSEDKGRLAWQFTYLVDDRRNAAGERMSGEKMLTPLSFSCAPELLAPERGKKIGILQVAKKALMPKISSSKLDPPALPSAPAPIVTQNLDVNRSRRPQSLPRRAASQSPVTPTRPRPPPQRSEEPIPSSMTMLSGAAPQFVQRTPSAPALRQRPVTMEATSRRPSATSSNSGPSLFTRRPATGSGVPSSHSRGGSLTVMSKTNPSFAQVFNVEIHAMGEPTLTESALAWPSHLPKKSLSTSSLWEAKASAPQPRAQKAVLLRPITSSERPETATQAQVVDELSGVHPRRFSDLKKPENRIAADDSSSSYVLPLQQTSSPRPHPRPQLEISTSPQTPLSPSLPTSAPILPLSPSTSRTDSPLKIPDDTAYIGGPIVSQEQIRAWLTETTPPAQSPSISPSHPFEFPIANARSSNDTSVSPPWSITTLPRPRGVSNGSRPQGGPPTISRGRSMARPRTSHEIRRKPPPIWTSPTPP